MITKISSPEVLTLEEAASYLRMAPALLRDKATHGIIPGQAIDDDSWRFLKSAIDTWLSRSDSRSVLLSQAGIFAGDEMLVAIQEQIDRDRQQNRFEADD
jgi:Helix-turn-helix domain